MSDAIANERHNSVENRIGLEDGNFFVHRTGQTDSRTDVDGEPSARGQPRERHAWKSAKGQPRRERWKRETAKKREKKIEKKEGRRERFTLIRPSGLRWTVATVVICIEHHRVHNGLRVFVLSVVQDAMRLLLSKII